MIPAITLGLELISKLGGIESVHKIVKDLLDVVHGRIPPAEGLEKMQAHAADFAKTIAAGNAERDKELHAKFDNGDK